MTTELTPAEIINSKVSELQERILASHPQMPLLLHEIHKALKEDPTVVTLLPEESIAIIVSGLEKQTNTYLAQTLTKSSTAKTKNLKNLKNADLGFDD